MCFGSTPHRKALPGWWIQTEDLLDGKKVLTTMLQNQTTPQVISLIPSTQLSFFPSGRSGSSWVSRSQRSFRCWNSRTKGKTHNNRQGFFSLYLNSRNKIMIVNRSSSESEGLRSGCWRLRHNSVNSV